MLFGLRRILRIYPAYFGALVLSIILLPKLAAIRFDVSLLLLPGGERQGWTAIPYWTLIYEVHFYSVAFLLMLNRARLYDIGLVVWAAFIFVMSLDFPHPADLKVGLEVLYSPLSLLFIGGACLARLHDGKIFPICAIAFFAACFEWWFKSFQIVWEITFIIGALAIIHAATLVPATLNSRFFRLAVRGGDYSYGLYLTHFIPIAALSMAGKEWNLWLLMVSMFILGAGFGLASGAMEYWAQRNYFRPLARRIAGLPPRGNVFAGDFIGG